MKLSGVIAIDKSGFHAKGQVRRSKVKVIEVKNPFIRFRTVTPVRIHIWRWNDAQSLCCLWEVSYCFTRLSIKFQGHTAQKSLIFTKIGRFQTVTPVWIHLWQRNYAQSLKQHRRGVLIPFKVICQNVKVTGVLAMLIRFEGFWTVTHVWTHWWLWNYEKSSTWYRRGALSFFKVIH